MQFDYSEKVQGLIEHVSHFMQEYIFPNEALMEEQQKAHLWSTPPLMETLKAEAKAQGSVSYTHLTLPTKA